MERVEVMRGGSDPGRNLLGPLPGVRHGDVLAYEFELPAQFRPWPGRTNLQRVFVLLDLGISLSNPVWREVTLANGDTGLGFDDPDNWYVDLVQITRTGSRYVSRDLYLDVIVPLDGRHQRLLDLDEFADALADGSLDAADAVDGLRRWQTFLDRHLHHDRDPAAAWTDFPPAAIRPLAAVPAPLGPPVRWRQRRHA
jgi:hypothetical protein